MTTPVPMLDLAAQHARIRNEVEAAAERVVASQRFLQGPEVEGLERELAAYAGAAEAVGCSSGSQALLLAYMALGVSPGDEVVVPTFTFFSTAGSVSRLGARPVFADIDPATYNVTAETLARALEGRRDVRLMVPVHLYGQAADMTPIDALGAERGIPVLEDAAQAIGAVDTAGRRAGSGANLSTLSFYPTKNLGAWGDGGMVLGSDPELIREIRVLANHGGETKYHHRTVGLAGRLDALQAAVLRAKLPHVDDWSDARAANAAAYDDAFLGAGALPSDVPIDEGGLPLRTPLPPKPPARHVYNQYVIRVPGEQREALRAHLAEREIGNDVYYPIPLHLQECYRELGGREGDLPHAERAAREVLALPIYPELTAAQRDAVTGAILDFVRSL